MLAIGCMYALRFALPSARNKALMGRLGVGLRVVVGGCGRWRWHSVYRLHVCFACLVLSYCPLGHYAVKRYLSHRKSVIFPTGKALSFLQDGKAPRGAEVPEGGAGLVYTYRYVKKHFGGYTYLHVSVGACLSGCGCGFVS